MRELRSASLSVSETKVLIRVQTSKSIYMDTMSPRSLSWRLRTSRCVFGATPIALASAGAGKAAGASARLFRLPARVRGISPSEMKFQPASPVTVTPVSAKKQHTGRRGFIKAVQFSAFFVRRPDWPKAKPEFGLSPDLNEAAPGAEELNQEPLAASNLLSSYSFCGRGAARSRVVPGFRSILSAIPRASVSFFDSARFWVVCCVLT
jgi:hypothetical protein